MFFARDTAFGSKRGEFGEARALLEVRNAAEDGRGLAIARRTRVSVAKIFTTKARGKGARVFASVPSGSTKFLLHSHARRVSIGSVREKVTT